MIDTSIILPSLNESKIIVDTLQNVAAYIAKNPWLGECEVIVVAAGRDDTADLAEAQRHLFTHLSVIRPSKARGKGSDVRAGFLAASGKVQLFMDADLSTPLTHSKPMIEALRKDADVVIGERPLAAIHHSPVRRVLSQAGPLASKLILGLKYKDTQCGFKGFRAEAAKALFGDLETMGWGFDLEILKRAKELKLQVQSIPINDWDEAREEGLRGQSTLQVARKTLRELFAIRAASFGRVLARRATSIFVLASVAAGGIAVWRNLNESIWFDEAFTAALIKRPISGIVQGTAHDVHPPLYYLLLKGWASIFGFSILTLRTFSVVCGVAAVFVALKFAQRLFGARVALWAVPFVVLAPFLLRYDIEARMYALASLVGISASYILVVALERWRAGRPSRWLWIWYALLVAIGMYSLYYTALIWIVHVLWCVLTRGRKERTLRQLVRTPWLRAFASAVVVYIPWLPTFLDQTHHVQNGFWISPPTTRTVTSVFSEALSYRQEWQLTSWTSCIFLVTITIAGWFVVRAWQVADRKQRPYLQLLVLATFVPVVVLFCASLPPHQPVFVTRYVAQTIISGYLLIGVSIAIAHRAGPRLMHWLGIFIVLGVLMGGVSKLESVGNGRHFNQVMSYVLSQHPERGTVVVQDNQQYLALHYYAQKAPWLRPNLGGANGLALGPTVQQINTPLLTHTVWYIYSGQATGKLAPPSPRYHLASIKTIDGMHVGRYER